MEPLFHGGHGGTDATQLMPQLLLASRPGDEVAEAGRHGHVLLERRELTDGEGGSPPGARVPRAAM